LPHTLLLGRLHHLVLLLLLLELGGLLVGDLDYVAVLLLVDFADVFLGYCGLLHDVRLKVLLPIVLNLI
jgi:hypothetical protein